MAKACRGMVNLVKTTAPIGRPSTLKNHHLIMKIDFKVIPIEKFHIKVQFKGKIINLNLKKKFLAIRGDFRTSAETRVSADQSFLKNHNYFYTNVNEVIQKLKYSCGSLVSKKKSKKYITPNTSIPEKLKQQRVQHAYFPCFTLPSLFLTHASKTLLNLN